MPQIGGPYVTELRRIGRFASVGAVSTILHIGLALILVSVFGWSSQSANLTAFGPALILSFLGHHHWTFHSRAPHASTALRFLLVSCLGYVASASVIGLLNTFLGPHHQFVVILGALVIPAVSYIANRFFVFR